MKSTEPVRILDIAKQGITAIQKAKAAAIAADAISGSSIKALAQKYGIRASQVSQFISLAEKSGFFERVEEQIMEHLIPPALAVYEAALERGDVEAARDVLYGMGIFRKVPKDQMDGIESITAYRILRKANDGKQLRQEPGSDILDTSEEGSGDGRVYSVVPGPEASGGDAGRDSEGSPEEAQR